MDLQQLPKTETEILVSVTDQELEKFDSELAALCNGIKAKKQTPSPTSQISNDFDESAAEFRALLAEGDRILPAFEKNVDNVVQLELRISALEKSTTLFDSQQKKSAAEQENLKQQLQLCRQEVQQIHDNQVILNQDRLALDAKVENIQQVCDKNNVLVSQKNAATATQIQALQQQLASMIGNQNNNKEQQTKIEKLERAVASSQFQFRCFATGVIGFIAGFLIWFYAHKAELLR